MSTIAEVKTYKDRLSTVNEKGNRVWVNPKKPKGKWHNRRLIFSWALIIFMVAGPLIKVNGEQFMLFNVLERKFIILGVKFWPQDFYLFVIAFLTAVVSIIFFTVIYGRLFCGWVCPQTIFMEIVFRKIEYLIEGDYTKQKKLDRMDWNTEKVIKKGLKHGIFLLLAFGISNLFTAYLVGTDQLIAMINEPVKEHLGTLMAVIGFSLAFYWVFGWFREQVCTIACPYGRLQGVLLDKDSVVVAYDSTRGEPRGKLRKNKEKREHGDCIDCKQCVHVCPTGIDIRNGTQMECINCTACIDECNSIMDRIGKPRGLVRYASENEIEKGAKFKFTKRMKAYSVVLVIMYGILSGFIFTRSDLDVQILKSRAHTYTKTSDGEYQNIYEINIRNNSSTHYKATLKIEDKSGTVQLIGGGKLNIPEREEVNGMLLVQFPFDELDGAQTKFEIGIYSDGELIETETVQFVGPGF